MAIDIGNGDALLSVHRDQAGFLVVNIGWPFIFAVIGLGVSGTWAII